MQLLNLLKLPTATIDIYLWLEKVIQSPFTCLFSYLFIFHGVLHSSRLIKCVQELRITHTSIADWFSQRRVDHYLNCLGFFRINSSPSIVHNDLYVRICGEQVTLSLSSLVNVMCVAVNWGFWSPLLCINLFSNY